MNSAALSVAGARSERDASLMLRSGWLAIMGALFFSTYAFANWLASTRASVPTFAFAWERAIPFMPWSIVPYWSIDVFYALSFLLCVRRAALHAHVRRLFTMQMISVACFIAWPLSFGAERPVSSGVTGVLFDLLTGIDKPYNQAPSLHIGLLIVLWTFYAGVLRNKAARAVLHLWFMAIGVSVLTTWQHHVIDVPTGAAVGAFALFLFPLADDVTGAALPCARSRRIAGVYATVAVALTAFALILVRHAVGAALVTGWVSLAFACVAWIYWQGSPAAFQKDERGRIPLAVRLLLAPAIAGAFINSRLWTRKRPSPVRVATGVSIGRTPTPREWRQHGFDALLDLTAEMPRWIALDQSNVYLCVPHLDLVPPTLLRLNAAVEALGELHRDGRDVLVCCALGYGRSVLCAAAWIAKTQGLHDARAALLAVRSAQRRAVWSKDTVALLQDWIDHCTVHGRQG
nr:phosphatase PAP2/dual specificity phosphatase family protein [Caballeronia zhejiangensis]